MRREPWCSTCTRRPSGASSSSAPPRRWPGCCLPSSWAFRRSSSGSSGGTRSSEVRPTMSSVGAPRWRRRALSAALVLLALLWLLPAVWMAVTSLKPTENIVRVPPEWIPRPATLAHYGEVLFSSSRTARIGRAFLNSVIGSVGTVAVVLVTSAMAAYSLARMRFPGRDLVFTVLVGSLMIPNAVVLVPQYVLTQRLGWLSTYPRLLVTGGDATFR